MTTKKVVGHIKNTTQEPEPPGAKAVVLYAKKVTSMTVSSPTDRTGAIDFLKAIKEQRASIVDFFADMKAKAHAAWKAITEKESFYTKQLDAVEKEVKQLVLTYDKEQERIRLEEERRLQAEAEAAAEAERKRLLALAAKAKSPTAKKELQQQAQAVEAEVVEVAPTLEYEKGESTRVLWKARIVDEKKIPREWLIPDLKALQAYASANKEKAKGKIPGVEFYADMSLAIGGK